MSNQSFKVKNGLTLSPIDLTTLLSPQAGDLACDINDSNKIKRYDALSASWVEVGSGAAGDVDTLLVQDFDSASLSSFTQTGLTLITTNPLDGRQSARLIHQPLAGAVQSFKETFSVSPKYRGVNMTASLLLRSSASQGNVTIQFRDETNSVDYPSQQLQTNSQEIASLVTNSTTTVSGFSNSVINSLRIGMSVTGSGIPTGTTIAAVNSTALTITLSQAATASATVSLRFSDLPRTIQLGFQIPENCSSYSYTISALQEAGSPETYVDDIVLKNYWLGMSNQGQSQYSYNTITQESIRLINGSRTTSGVVNNFTTGLTNLSEIASYNSGTGTITLLKEANVTAWIFGRNNASAAGGVGILVNGNRESKDSNNLNSYNFAASATNIYPAGTQFTFDVEGNVNTIEAGFSATAISIKNLTTNDLVPAKAVLGNTAIDVPNVTGWQGYTPTFQGFGTPTNIEFEWRQVGENVEIRGKFTAGTSTAVEARVGLPAGLTSAGTSLIPSLQMVGTGGNTTNSSNIRVILIEPSVSYITFGIQTNGTPAGTIVKVNGSDALASSATMSFFASVPCAGLSATEEVVVSGTQSALVEESDSYLFAFGSTLDGTNRITTANISSNIGSAFIIDTSAGYVKLKVSKNGIYAITFNADGTSSSLDRQAIIQLNGSNLSNQRDIGNGAGEGFTLTNTTTRYLTTDDFLTFLVTGSSSRNYNIQASYQGSLKQLNVSSDQKITIPTSELRFEGASARGSTDTGIVQFTSMAKLRGDAFTVESDAVLGTRITMKKAGKLDVSSTLVLPAGGQTIQITLNQSTRTTTSTVSSEILSTDQAYTNVSVVNASWSGDVKIGDIVRISASGTPSANNASNVSFSFQEQDISVSVTNTLPQFSESDSSVRVDTANGYGSTASNKIRRFSNQRDNIGSDISYVDDPANGATFTIRTSGVYNISYSDNFNTSSRIAITKNQSNLTASLGALPASEILRISQTTAAGSCSASWQGYLSSGDIIRGAGDGIAVGSDPTLVGFTISKVGKPNVTGVDVTPFVNLPQPEIQFSRLNQVVSFGIATITGSLLENTNNGLYSYNASTGIYTALKTLKVTITASLIGSAVAPAIIKNSTTIALEFAPGVAGQSGSVTACFRVFAGETFSVQNQANTTTSQVILVAAEALSDQILTAPETFSTDTASLSYASSAAYTLSTLQNAPVGTFITFTYAANTNTRTQTTTAPTQTTADMNTNGILLYTRAYNAASTAAQPTAIAIQIGKGLKGRSLDLYKSAGKVTAGSLDYFSSSSTSEFGITNYNYNEVTGILYLDAAVSLLTSAGTARSFFFSDITSQTSGYLVINASKSPALTGVPLLQPRIATLSDVKASGTAGGTATSGSYQTRTLNTIDDPTGIVTSLASNQFTLPAGEYYIEADAASFNCEMHRIRIQNITDGTTSILGSNAYSRIVANAGTSALLKGDISISSTKTFELQHRVGTTQATTGFGLAASFGDNEVHAVLKITKVK